MYGSCADISASSAAKAASAKTFSAACQRSFHGIRQPVPVAKSSATMNKRDVLVTDNVDRGCATDHRPAHRQHDSTPVARQPGVKADTERQADNPDVEQMQARRCGPMARGVQFVEEIRGLKDKYHHRTDTEHRAPQYSLLIVNGSVRPAERVAGASTAARGSSRRAREASAFLKRVPSRCATRDCGV